ncbi:MAG: FGGY family carbohydrate kinase [Christiangramia sp.]
MKFLGIDLGSSSIKLSVFDAEKGTEVVAVTVPENEMEIQAPKFGWAEQDPELWWSYVKQGLSGIAQKGINLKEIQAIGIAYQMHGLVVTDEHLKPIRPSIIWCDSRAVEAGREAFDKYGPEKCLQELLGSPGNFTASKLKWVREQEPDVYQKIRHIMLPGDFIAARLTRVPQTSQSGLSEAALWNFPEGRLATELLESMGLDAELVPEIVPNFGKQATIHPEVAAELGLNNEVSVTYRAGDQPNNAFSLNVLEPGEIATTAGTSAVVYSVSDENVYDKESRINTFLHVNNSEKARRNGVMLCINGSGISYQWLQKLLSAATSEPVSYEFLNQQAASVGPGSEQLLFYPFGNGVERIFQNKKANSGIENLNFNLHKPAHIVRAACEGIVFAMNYGFEVMKDLGVQGNTIKAGKANLFLSPTFREIFVNTTQTNLKLYNTSGAEGAARGAACGFGYYKNMNEAFSNLKVVESLEPESQLIEQYAELYEIWKQGIKIEK